MLIDADVEVEAAVELVDAETEAIAELVDDGAVQGEAESGLAFFVRTFGCEVATRLGASLCDDVFLALASAFFFASSSFSFFFCFLSSFLFCFSSASLLFLSSFSFKIASPSELVSTRSPITRLESPFVLLGVAGTCCTKYFEIRSRPGVELLEPGVLDELEAGEETVSEEGEQTEEEVDK